jgi:hypothetical protein
LSDKELSVRLASAAALKHLIFAHAGTMSAEAYVQVVLACVQCCASEKTSKGQQGLLGLVDTALSKCPLVDPGTGAMFNEALAFPELASSLESFTRYLLVLLKETKQHEAACPQKAGDKQAQNGIVEAALSLLNSAVLVEIIVCGPAVGGIGVGAYEGILGVLQLVQSPSQRCQQAGHRLFAACFTQLPTTKASALRLLQLGRFLCASSRDHAKSVYLAVAASEHETTAASHTALVNLWSTWFSAPTGCGSRAGGPLDDSPPLDSDRQDTQTIL